MRLVIMAVLIASFSTLALKRNALWKDEYPLWGDTVAKNPLKARPHNNFGRALRVRGELDRAIGEWLKTLSINPYYAPARSNLASVYLSLGRLEEAEKELLVALELGIRAGVEYPDIHNTLGVIHLKRKDWEPAAAEFERALSLNPGYEPARKNLSYAYAEIGYSYGERKDPATALKFFKNALSIDPESLPAIYGYALSLEEMGNKKEAEKIWRNYLETAPLDDPFREEIKKRLNSSR